MRKGQKEKSAMIKTNGWMGNKNREIFGGAPNRKKKTMTWSLPTSPIVANAVAQSKNLSKRSLPTVIMQATKRRNENGLCRVGI